MTSDIVLTDEINRLAKRVRTLAARDRQPDPELIEVAEELEISGLLSYAIEQELAIFRQLEAGKSTRIAIEVVSTEAVMPIGGDGNVVAPDFGRRS